VKEKSCHGDCTAGFGHALRIHRQELHGLANLVFTDGDDVVDVFLDVLEVDRSHALCAQTIGDGPRHLLSRELNDCSRAQAGLCVRSQFRTIVTASEGSPLCASGSCPLMSEQNFKYEYFSRSRTRVTFSRCRRSPNSRAPRNSPSSKGMLKRGGWRRSPVQLNPGHIVNGILTGFHERQNPVQPASTAWDLQGRSWNQTERAGARDIGEKETAETSVVRKV